MEYQCGYENKTCSAEGDEWYGIHCVDMLLEGH